MKSATIVHNIRMIVIVIITLIFGGGFLLCVTPQILWAALTDTEIQKRLAVKYEQNADEMMSWLQHQQFDNVEAFLGYVVKNNVVTRDGIDYLTAILEYWFGASEVLEFNRIKPVPQDILPYLNTWIEHSPKNANAYIIRGVYYIEHAWEIRGRGWAQDVKKEHWPSFQELHLLAKTDLEKAYELDPFNPVSSRELMRVQRALNAKDTKATETYFQQAIKNYPTFYWAYRAKLENLMPKWGGTWETMFAFAAETAQGAPPKTLLPHVLAYALEEAAARSQNSQKYYTTPQVWETLEQIYKQIITDFPLSTRWKVRFARIAADAGKGDIAASYLKSAEETDPTDYRIYELKALLAEHQEQWTIEEENARRVIQLCPVYEMGYSMLGYALGQQKRYQEAVENYTSAIELAPLSSYYWSSRCHYYNWLAEFEKAIADCTSAIELNQDNAFAYQQRKYAYERLGKTQEAEADRKMYERLTQK